MKQVWKYELVQQITVIEMPKGARVLSAANQRESICIWAEVDVTSEAKETRKFEIAGTGTAFHRFDSREFIGTVLMSDGLYVFHVYEVR